MTKKIKGNKSYGHFGIYGSFGMLLLEIIDSIYILYTVIDGQIDNIQQSLTFRNFISFSYLTKPIIIVIIIIIIMVSLS